MTTRMTATPDLFHPLEISFCGYSGRGKTTLITKLIQKFSVKFRVGYIKHDAHKFIMDREGKDTFKASHAGAFQVAINSPKQTALLVNCNETPFFMRQNYCDCDVVFIEGHKGERGTKILLWDDTPRDHLLLESLKANPHVNLLAIAGERGKFGNGKMEGIPYFDRDDVDGIENQLLTYWQQKISARPLYGLILRGGHSRRMGRDKGAISYHGRPQVDFLYDLLNGLLDRIYISCRSDQIDKMSTHSHFLLEDRYLGFGPMGGIMSAFHRHPEASWLVVACDMPFLCEEALGELIRGRNPYKMATCFFNEEKDWPEPLCAIYEPKAAIKMGMFLSMGKICPRKILMNSSVQILDPKNSKALTNINTPQELQNLEGGI